MAGKIPFSTSEATVAQTSIPRYSLDHLLKTSCKAHPGETTVLFCLTCDQSGCLSCVTENVHPSHNMCKLHEVIERKEKEFDEAIKTEGLENILGRVGDCLAIIGRTKLDITKQQEKRTTSILSTVESLAKLVEEVKIDVMSRSKQAHESQMKVLDMQEAVSSRCVGLLRKYKSDPESFLNNHRQLLVQIMEDLRNLKEIDIPKVQDDKDSNVEVGESCVRKYVQSLFGVCSDAQTISKQEGELGKIAVKLGQRIYGSHALYISKISPIDMEHVYVLLKNDSRTFGVLFKVPTGYPDINVKDLTPIATNVTDMTRVTEKGVYICHDNTVQLYTHGGKFFDLDNISPNTLKCICITKDGNIMYCSQEGKTGKDRIVYYRTHYIDPTGYHLDKSDKHWKREEDENIMHGIEEQGGEPLVYGKRERCYKPGGYVEKCCNYLIAIYNGKLGSDLAKSFHPTGLCFDKNGQIIIADYMNSAIHLLNKNWTFKKFLLREWDGVKHPTAVTLDNDGYLWIGQKNGVIQVQQYYQ